jgi:stage III sporulation protein SpoIIIAA
MEQEVSILLLGDPDVGKTTFLSYVLCAFSSTFSMAIRILSRRDTLLACYLSHLLLVLDKHTIQIMT